MAEVIRTNLPCPKCTSHDAYSIYSDGSGYCFSCETYFKNGMEEDDDGVTSTVAVTRSRELIQEDMMEFRQLKSRCISMETCEKYHYYVTKINEKTIQVAEYRDDDGRVLFQKTRDKEKNFKVLGTSCYRFFGQDLFNKGKKLVITEGEIDALSVSQMNGNKYPVVSLPHGCGSAVKTFKAQMEWLNNFDEVILMFDMDEHGQKAVQDVCGLLPPHKLFIAHLPYKDANECLVRGAGSAILNAIFDAKEYRPDGIVNANDLEEIFFSEEDDDGVSYDFPWNCKLNKMTQGLRKREMVLVTAGTGIGKSTAVREIAYKLKTKDNLKIGMVMLEENVKKTLRELLSLAVNKPLSVQWRNVNREELRVPFHKLFGDGNFFLYDHFGALDEKSLLEKIRYLIVGEGCDFIIFDHISIAVSSLEESGSDERKTIDRIMTKLRSLVEETGAGIIVVSHLKKPNTDNAFEEGGVISMDDLRGSGSLKQIPDTIIALERNQQSEEEYEKNKIKIRVLKCRLTGDTGVGGYLVFDKETHRLQSEEEITQF